MSQYIIVNDTYTKGQRNVLNKFNSLFGKTYKETSLISEINKILSSSKWNSSSTKDKLLVTSDHLGMKLTAEFDKLSFQEYKLSRLNYI